MKAIATKYKGYKFRSRLEARWAVFFDACGVNWEYEPEGFDLGDGIYYLPDFLLHDVFIRNSDELWVEVKGQMTNKDVEKIQRFGGDIIILNRIPHGENFWDIIWDINNMYCKTFDNTKTA